ncbi:MAG: hypothetical protein QOD44_1345, partial [Solirubrobacteraceae bacterium]|nr:hypothetical protein [Solirubrobacteraceae bacterium]
SWLVTEVFSDKDDTAAQQAQDQAAGQGSADQPQVEPRAGEDDTRFNREERQSPTNIGGDR